MKNLTIYLISFILLSLTASAQSTQETALGLDTLGLKTIFYEPLLAGNRADFAEFTPDQSAIYYYANDSSMIEEELFKVSLDGENRSRVMEDSVELSFEVSSDHKKLAYTVDGDVWLTDMHFTSPEKIISTPESESNLVWGPDKLRFSFVRKGNVYIMNVKTPRIIQLTDKKDKEPGYSIVDWAGSGRLVVRQYDDTEVKTVYFPEYIHLYVKPGGTKRGLETRCISVINIDSGKKDTLYAGKNYVNVEVSAAGRYVALDMLNTSMKNRRITVFDLKDGTSEVVFQDKTDGWFYGTEMSFGPEGNKIMFLSEQDGWNHIYTVKSDGSRIRQRTEGKYEVPWAAWIDGDEIVYASTEVGPGERHLYLLNLATGDTEKLTEKMGYRQNFVLSRDRKHIVYQYSYFNIPFQLYTINLDNPGQEIQLTHTIPDRFKKIDWQVPDYFHFTGRDGKTEIYMQVLKPWNIKSDKEHPVMVFAHGAGSLQNVYKGWSDHYYREYMFNQWLTTHGYYVMQVDYRHSTGYGRDFRDAVTGWMGKYETHDIVDGLKYLAGHYPQVDTSRVGIYGGSYGGFMALYATSVAPEYFDAAAALRAVTNWINYYHSNPWYTKPRLGTPEKDSINYARSSPLTYIDQLQHPVLILHGLMDNNVPFQDAAQYINKLIQAGNKEFYMMMYPAERHSFKDSDAWYDEYSRIYRFFERELR